MVGTKLYASKTRVYAFVIVYGLLGVAGIVLIAQALSGNQPLPAAGGFMAVFGAGMVVMTIVNSRKPQVSVYEDFIEVRQSRAVQYARYRHIVSVDRPDGRRLVVKLREGDAKKEVTIWLKELEKKDVDGLEAFLSTKARKGK